MLILTRKTGQSIEIDGGVKLDVLACDGQAGKAVVKVTTPDGHRSYQVGKENTLRPREDVALTVCGIATGKIRLGFEAPRDVNIYRGEIADERRQGVTS